MVKAAAVAALRIAVGQLSPRTSQALSIALHPSSHAAPWVSQQSGLDTAATALRVAAGWLPEGTHRAVALAVATGRAQNAAPTEQAAQRECSLGAQDEPQGVAWGRARRTTGRPWRCNTAAAALAVAATQQPQGTLEASELAAAAGQALLQMQGRFLRPRQPAASTTTAALGVAAKQVSSEVAAALAAVTARVQCAPRKQAVQSRKDVASSLGAFGTNAATRGSLRSGQATARPKRAAAAAALAVAAQHQPQWSSEARELAAAAGRAVLKGRMKEHRPQPCKSAAGVALELVAGRLGPVAAAALAPAAGRLQQAVLSVGTARKEQPAQRGQQLPGTGCLVPPDARLPRPAAVRPEQSCAAAATRAVIAQQWAASTSEAQDLASASGRTLLHEQSEPPWQCADRSSAMSALLLAAQRFSSDATAAVAVATGRAQHAPCALGAAWQERTSEDSADFLEVGARRHRCAIWSPLQQAAGLPREPSAAGAALALAARQQPLGTFEARELAAAARLPFLRSRGGAARQRPSLPTRRGGSTETAYLQLGLRHAPERPAPHLCHDTTGRVIGTLWPPAQPARAASPQIPQLQPCSPACGTPESSAAAGPQPWPPPQAGGRCRGDVCRGTGGSSAIAGCVSGSCGPGEAFPPLHALPATPYYTNGCLGRLQGL
mmetsp:Transcript_56420/g.174943  ORF Transcript_56420/g.174943 Transcript_56420/m.174943 type:complete len:664 (-) Transcript_56420:333-2324(-)